MTIILKDNKMIKEVKFGTLNKRNAAFVAFFLKSPCYKGYSYVKEDVQKLNIPQVLLLQRWDGKMGFVGGMVDEGEDILTSALRETREEIGFNIEEHHLQLREVCSHETSGDLNVHLYAVEIDLGLKRLILSKAHEAADYEAETCGVIFQQILDIEKNGFNAFLENAYLAKAVKEELEIMRDKFNLTMS